MQQTRRETVDELLDFVGELDDPTARETANRLVNRALLKMWLRHPWRQFWMPTPYTFSTVAGQRAYPLPDYFGRLGSQHGKVRNLSTGGVLSPMQPEQLEELAPEAGTSLDTLGSPSVFTIGGTVGVSVQPTTVEAVTVESSDGADVDVVVSLEGLDASNAWMRAQFTLNGVTPVACGIWSRIVAFGKSYLSRVTPTTLLTSSRGTISLKGASTGTLEAILPAESAVEHQEIVLYPTPSTSGQSIGVPTLRSIRRLLYDSDVVPAYWGPALFEELLIQWRVFNGELTTDADADRPAFRDLVAFDNTGRLTVPERVRGWSG